jgi:hypothetical protein
MCSPETADSNGEYSRAKLALWLVMQLPEDQAEALAVWELTRELVPVAYKSSAPVPVKPDQ